VYDEALRKGRRLRLVASDGRRLPIDLERWTAPADAVDERLLDRCVGATLDVGCGPGRLTAALASRGQPVLGVDVARSAVRRTTALGAPAVCGSVFDPVPGEGRWDTVLLADGNLGIGGDPDRLLARVADLLRPGGRVVVEPEHTEVDEVVDLALQVADGSSAASEPFPWARLGPLAVARRGRAAGFAVLETWASAGRSFVVLDS
jgi:SAM-dependent methyltransferase